MVQPCPLQSVQRVQLIYLEGSRRILHASPLKRALKASSNRDIGTRCETTFLTSTFPSATSFSICSQVWKISRPWTVTSVNALKTRKEITKGFVDDSLNSTEPSSGQRIPEQPIMHEVTELPNCSQPMESTLTQWPFGHVVHNLIVRTQGTHSNVAHYWGYTLYSKLHSQQMDPICVLVIYLKFVVVETTVKVLL